MEEELRVLQTLDSIVRQETVSPIIDSLIVMAERKLDEMPEILFSWERVPLTISDPIFPKKFNRAGSLQSGPAFL